MRSRSPGDEKYSDRQTGSRRRESRRSRRHDVDYPKDRRQSPAETEKSDKHWVAATDHTSTILEPPVEPSRSQDGQDAFALALSKVRLDAQGIKRQDTRVVQESLPPPSTLIHLSPYIYTLRLLAYMYVAERQNAPYIVPLHVDFRLFDSWICVGAYSAVLPLHPRPYNVT